ncbi:MBL fold metallo-hydrolase [Clostridia bacterium]|nr:MBL fold metallo-hydrolase [Clostridia bacterium]
MAHLEYKRPDEKAALIKMYSLEETAIKTPVLTKVKEGHYAVIDYGLGNVGIVITNEGVVVIDSNTTNEAASEIIKEIRKITSQPIKYLIITHGHGDHVGGNQAFKDAGAEIIAHENVNIRLERYKTFAGYHARINGIQAGGGGFGQLGGASKWASYVRADIEYDKEYIFELGGKTFRLIHGKGETDDATIVYIPEDRVIYAGDFIISVFPNIGNPNKVLRYEKEWVDALDRILSLNPEAVVPGHGTVLFGDEIISAITAPRDVLDFLYRESVKYINEGRDLDYILEHARLPQKLAQNPYIKPIYGNREFTLRGIWRRYTGWYDQNPTNLYPSPKDEVIKAVFSLIQDEELVLNKAKALKAENQIQLALHILDLLPEPGKEAMLLKAEILEELADRSTNLFYVNFYLNGAAILRQNVGGVV